MNLKFNEKSKICFGNIDTQINIYIKKGKDIEFIKKELQAKISKFEVLLSDLDESLPKYNFLKRHNDVCLKRIMDFTIIERLKNSKCDDLSTLFGMIKLRDKFLRLS
jgi:hypothetical protein